MCVQGAKCVCVEVIEDRPDTLDKEARRYERFGWSWHLFNGAVGVFFLKPGFRG